MFETTKIDVFCPDCGRKFTKALGDITRHDKTQVRCPGCGATITVDAKQARRELEKVEKAIKDLGRAFKGR